MMSSPIRFGIAFRLLVYSLTLILIPVVAIGTIAYATAVKTGREEILRSRTNAVLLAARNLDYVFSDVEDVSLFFIRDGDFRDLFLAPRGVANAAYLPIVRRTNEYLWYLFSAKRYIHSIYLRGLNGIVIDPDNTHYVLDEEMERTLVERKGMFAWYPNRTAQKYARAERGVLTFARFVNDVADITRGLGFLVINIDEEHLREVYRGIGETEEEESYIVDGSGNIVSALGSGALAAHAAARIGVSAADLSGDGPRKVDFFRNGMPMTLIRVPLRTADFSLVNVGRAAEPLARRSALVRIAFYGSILSAAVAGLFAFLFSRATILRLNGLSRAVTRIGSGDFAERAAESGSDEIAFLGKSVNRMATMISTLIDEVYVVELRRKEAELDAMEARVDPHFLYNVLDTIYWKCRLERAFDSAELVRALSSLFRRSLHRGDHFAALGEELEHVESYMLIQKERYGNRIAFVDGVRKEYVDCIVVRFTLQPLVENAVIHGFADPSASGTVSVSSRIEGDVLVCVVEDDGAGIDTELASRVLRGETEGRARIGLKNVNDRLILTFGENFGLRITRREEGGTRVEIRQPFSKVRP